ncbi:hypothetical protein ACHAWT_007762 [Skeletonema menzelii]
MSSRSLNNSVEETNNNNNGPYYYYSTNNEAKSSTTFHNNSNSNANPNEVHKFSSFASHWWDSRSNPLVGMNPIRIKFLRDVVDSFQPTAGQGSTPQPIIQLPLHNKRILDIGCGGGLLTESLSRLGASLVVGVDASTQVVEVAKRHSFHENSRLVLPSSSELQDGNGLVETSSSSSRDIRYIGGITVEELASNWLQKHEQEKSSSSTINASSSSQNHELFDIITALEIIEHVPNPSSLLNAAKSLLKPNGILLVSTINRTVKSYGLAIIAAEYISGKVPIGTHTWDMFWSPEEVEQMICSSSSSYQSYGNDANGKMKQIALSGMVLQPPFINMEWKLDGNDTDVNWIGAYQKQQV